MALTTGNIAQPGRPAAKPNPKTTEANNGRKPQRSLDRKELYQLFKLLDEWKNELDETRPSYESVAARATDALKFEVTAQNVRHAARDMGITWKAYRSDRGSANPARHPKGGQRYWRYLDLRNRVETAEQRVETLRAALATLMSSGLGVTVPPGLVEKQFGGSWPEKIEQDKGE